MTTIKIDKRRNYTVYEVPAEYAGLSEDELIEIRNEVVDRLYKGGFVKHYVKKLCGHVDDYDDIIQELYVNILDININRFLQFYVVDKENLTKLIQFISGIVCRLMCSANSPIYYKYKKKRKTEISISSEDINVDELLTIYNNAY